MIIDVHNHFYPAEYLAALGPLGSIIKVTYDNDGNPLVHYPGDYNILVRGHRDIAYREEVLEAAGVDVQVISLTTPGTHIESPSVAAALATITNDAFARIRDDRGARFLPLATLPLAPLTDDAKNRLPEIIGRMQSRLVEESPPGLRKDLWAATFLSSPSLSA